MSKLKRMVVNYTKKEAAKMGYSNLAVGKIDPSGKVIKVDVTYDIDDYATVKEAWRLSPSMVC